MSLSKILIRVILASDSPRRRELMPLLTGKYGVCSPKVEEVLNPDLSPEEATMDLAKKKAKSVQKKYPRSLILGCDTIVVLDNEIFGKPKDKKEATRMLKKLRGKTHKVITGCTFVSPFLTEPFYEVTQVTMYPLSDKQIQMYVKENDVTEFAGGYAIQHFSFELVEKIEGSHFNVVGFPLEALAKRYLRRVDRGVKF